MARLCGVARVALYVSVGSTLDVAHVLGARGAPAGTLVLADSQTAGRGRQGRRWHSDAGRGIWLTMLERPADTMALDVLSLRIGLAIAPVLDLFAAEPVRLKWPNDLYLGAGKLGGVLIETRWREAAVDWVAIGVGVNVRAPATERAAALPADVARVDVLRRLVPAIRDAALRTGLLRDDEMAAFAARDLAVGRECLAPVRGRVRGIEAGGALVVDADASTLVVRAGSLVFKEEA